jgi:fatty-acyl-CoA synthase
MNPTGIRLQLLRKLDTARDKILLTIVTSSTGESVDFTLSDILERARNLTNATVDGPRAAIVLLLLPHCPELFLLQIGLVLEGFCPAVLPWPTTRIDPEKYRRNLVHQLNQLPADCLITIPELAFSLNGALTYPARPCIIKNPPVWTKEFEAVLNHDGSAPHQHKHRATLPSDYLFLQFSGGTTGTQKCVVVTERMLSQQLTLLYSAINGSDRDGVGSWLPMYHDMGLIACLWFPLWFGMRSAQIAASDWLINPEILFQCLQNYRGTLCWLPNFAFSYLAQRRESIRGRYDLSGVRAWVNCSEPVRTRSMRAFYETYADFGVRHESLQACYAMAETVFAVTQTKPGRPPSTTHRQKLRASTRIDALAFDLADAEYVSSGRTLPDTHVRIVDASGRLCSDLEPGEIQIDSPSLFSGYWGFEGFTRSAFTSDNWYSTGDYGFMHDHELYVIGRLKDIIIIAGQNIFPEDVEFIVNSVEGVYPGRAVAFGLDDQERGTQSLVVVAEMKGDYDESRARTTDHDIRQAVLTSIGIAPRYVDVVPQRWIVKSTAGKISRRDTRERFIRENRTERTDYGG